MRGPLAFLGRLWEGSTELPQVPVAPVTERGEGWLRGRGNRRPDGTCRWDIDGVVKPRHGDACAHLVTLVYGNEHGGQRLELPVTGRPGIDVGALRMAIGVYNQLVYVDPQTRTTIVKLSANRRYGTSPDEATNRDAENVEFLRAVAWRGSSQ